MSTKHGTAIASPQYGVIKSPHNVRGSKVPAPTTGLDRSFFKLDSTGSVVWTYDSGHDGYDIGHNSGHTWGVGERTASWEGNDGTSRSAWKLDSFGKLLNSADVSTTLFGVAVASDGSCYVVGDRSTIGTGSNANCWKINADGTVAWGYDTGVASQVSQGVYHDGTHVYLTGFRDTGGAISIWALNPSAGTLDWSADTGGNTVGCWGDGSSIFVNGTRTNTWTGAGGSFASHWKLSTGGSFVWGSDDGGSGNAGNGAGASGGKSVGSFVGTPVVHQFDSSGTSEWSVSMGDTPEGCSTDGSHVWCGCAPFTSWSGLADTATVLKIDSSGTVIWGWRGGTQADDFSHGVFTEGSGFCWVATAYDSNWAATANTP